MNVKRGIQPGPADPDLLDDLMQIGFTGPESVTYEALLRLQPATAYELAKISGLARTNSYNAVTNLSKAGAIQPISSNPVRYAVSSPQHFFSNIADEVSSTARRIQGKVEVIAEPVGNQFVEVMDGKVAVENKIASLIDSARKDLQITSSFTLIEPFLDKLKSALQRGSRLTIVAVQGEWDELAEAGAQIVPHEGTGSAPSGANDVLITIVADAEAAFVGTLSPIHRGYSAENPTLVYVIQKMILHEIYLSKIVSAVGLEKLEQLGISFKKLRAQFRPPLHGMNMAINP